MNNKEPFSSSSRYNSPFEKGFFSSLETYIHPTAIVGPNVHLGTNVKIGPYSILVGNIVVEDNTRIYSHVTIGFPAQEVSTLDSYGTIIIGKNCHIREFVSIHTSMNPAGITRIGNNCYIMNFCHVSHDVILEDNVRLINNVNLGGHVHVESNVMLMANSAVHQHCRIGKYSCLAPFSATRQDLPPFCIFSGQPAGFSGLNIVGLKRAHFSSSHRNALKTVTKLFYQDKILLDDIKNNAILKNIDSDAQEPVETFLTFIGESKRGVSRRIITSYGKEEIE